MSDHDRYVSFMCGESRHLKCIGNCDCRCHGAHSSDAGLLAAAEKAFALLGLGEVARASKNPPVEAYRVLEAALNAPAAVCDAVLTCLRDDERPDHCLIHKKTDEDFVLTQESGKFPATGGDDA